MIKFHQIFRLNPCIDMNIQLGKEARNNFEKDFFKLMNNAVFEKIVKNVGKCRNIKILKTKRKKNYLVSEPNYHTTKFLIK